MGSWENVPQRPEVVCVAQPLDMPPSVEKLKYFLGVRKKLILDEPVARKVV